MTRSSLLPTLLFLAACGGGGGEPSTPPLLIAKGAPSGDGQSGVVTSALAQPLRVVLTQDGTPVAGQSVTFTASGGSGSVVPSPALTDANGVASATWTLGQTAGARVVTVTSPGATGGPIQFGATALAGPAADLTVVGGEGQLQEVLLSFTSPLVVRSFDAFGNTVGGVVVDWTVATGSGAPAAANSLSSSGGDASVIVTAGGTPGTLVIRATSANVPGDTVTFPLTVTPVASVITISSNFFTPRNDTIPVGGAVRWVWNSGPHNIGETAGPAEFPGSPPQSTGAAYGPILFTVAGTYSYECSIHTGMTGTITVQ